MIAETFALAALIIGTAYAVGYTVSAGYVNRALCIHFFGWPATVANQIRTKRILRALGKGALWCIGFVIVLAIFLYAIPLAMAL